jgi:hypothetical protein
MQYVCDAPNGKTWFRIETEGEAVHESRLMGHTVEKYFRREREKAVQSWHPKRPNAIERDIGLEAHVQREMPLFLTLRDKDGNALTTAMLPPGWQRSRRVPDYHRCRIQCRSLSSAGRGHRCAGSAFRYHTRSRPLLPLRPLTMSAHGTSETNGDDARRSACSMYPDIARISSKDRL